MKKFSVFLPVFVASFFLLLPNVSADNFSLELSSDLFDIIENNLPTLKSTVENFISTHPEYSSDYYLIYRSNANSNQHYYFSLLPSSYSCNPYNFLTAFNQVSFSGCSGYRSYFYISDDLTTISFVSDNAGQDVFYMKLGAYPSLLYINFFVPINETINSNSYLFSYNDKSYHFSTIIGNNGEQTIPSIYDLYLYFGLGSPISEPDNTPILTNFYSVAGSKIGWLGEQIVSNYIYLSIIGVFILIFIIELIRRYFL